MNKLPIFNYVGSGISHTRLTNYTTHENDVVIDIVRHISSDIQNKNNHKISVLFNAFTEKPLSTIFDVFFNGAMENIFSDSGGLQMITLGKTITDELKQKIYKLQAEMSDMAMCFDEIPIVAYNNSKIINGSTKVISEKRYDKNMFLPCVTKTRENLIEQVNYFLECNSRAKAMPILQGNSVEDYLLWHDLLFKNISQEQYSKINGISIGFLGIGWGIKNTIQICKVLKNLQTDQRNIHLLGVGSITRFLPFIILFQSGYFGDKFDRISYDSTSHSHCSTRGKYLKQKDKLLVLDRHKTNNYHEAWTDFSLVMKDYITYMNIKHGIDFNEDVFYHTVCNQANYENWGKFPRVYKGIFTFMYFITQVLNFTWTINELCNNKKYLREYIEKYDANLIYLLDAKTDQDLDRWLQHSNSSDKSMSQTVPDISDLF